MLDVQRDRLRHLLANAILELWKKETGSLTPVVIEGTICITTGTGKTTVVQVANKFYGGIPDLPLNDSSYNDSSGFFDCELSRSGRKSDSCGQTDTPLGYHSQTRLISRDISKYKSFYGKQSSSQSDTAAADENCGEPLILSGKRKLSDDDAEERKAPRVKEQVLSSEDSGSDVSDVKKEKGSAGPVCPGTGYYTCQTPPTNSKKAINKSLSDYDGSVSDDCDVDGEHFEPGDPKTTSTPAHNSPIQLDSGRLSDGSTGGKHRSDDCAVDLSKKDLGELALSSPYSYTEQVRGVIRERLLRASESSTPTPTLEIESKSRSMTPPPYLPGMMMPSGKRSFSHSWPGTARDKQLFHSSLFSPQNHALPSPAAPGFSSPLTVGLPSIPGYTPTSSTSQGLVFPFPPRHGLSPVSPLHDMLKPNQASPGQSSLSPDDTNAPVFPSPTPREKSPPELTDVNGNTEKDPATGEQKIYRCEFCNKTFLFKSKYHEHLPVHTNARPFQCHMCSRTYKYKYDLRVHLRTHLGIPTKSTICPFCSAKFSTNKVLRVHIQDAHRERQRASEEEIAQVAGGDLTPAI